ncbi:MAG: DUF1559 domain-containing protein [Pirellulaceae bacterium]|nr:DUF1559 domain-containing protein [Pirellulaceae bacterium]
MKRCLLSVAVLAILLTPLLALAQDSGLGAVAPFVNADTVAVVRVNLTKIDLPAAVKSITTAVPEGLRGGADLKHVETEGEVIRKALVDNGVSEAFAVWGAMDIRQPEDSFFIVLPVGKGKDPQDVIAAIEKIAGSPPPEALPIVHGAILLGPPHKLEGLKEIKSAPRPDLAKAMAASKGASIQIAAALPAEMRRVLAESLDKLPKEIGGGSGQDLADGLQWLAIGIDAPPKLSLTLTLQAKDAKSAQQVRSTLSTAVNMFANNEEATANFPPLKTLLPMLLPEAKGDKLVLALTEENGKAKKIMDELIKPAVISARGAAARAQSSNNLKQIMLAMHNYHDTYRHFPAAYGMKKDGTKLLSWRVYLLPFLEEAPLYEEFHLDEPWDSEHNKKLISKMPKIFASPSLPEELAKKGMASYVGPVGEKTIFAGSEATSLQKILDGTSNTLAILEADAEHVVIWTKPDDLPIDWKEPKRGLELWKSGTSSVFLAGFCDGSVRGISEKIDSALLKKLLQMDDGEPIGDIP